LSNPTIAFIGAGNMASSIIGGLIATGFKADNIIATARHAETLAQLSSNTAVRTTTDNDEAVANADVVVLAVKPQVMRPVAEALANSAQQRKPLIISVAAGIESNSLDQWLGGDMPIVRCMPNTPSLVQTGATGLFANTRVSEQQKKIADQILRAVGLVLWVAEENELHAVTAVSGSAPAYFFLFMEAMQASAEKMGLGADTAKQLTLQTALGAAKMAIASDVDTAELRRRVTSPGGTTAEAIRVFEQQGLADIVEQAMIACSDRSKELAKILGED
jgi:pyrroline-5-carboxylate reductase